MASYVMRYQKGQRDRFIRICPDDKVAFRLATQLNACVPFPPDEPGYYYILSEEAVDLIRREPDAF